MNDTVRITLYYISKWLRSYGVDILIILGIATSIMLIIISKKNGKSNLTPRPYGRGFLQRKESNEQQKQKQNRAREPPSEPSYQHNTKGGGDSWPQFIARRLSSGTLSRSLSVIPYC